MKHDEKVIYRLGVFSKRIISVSAKDGTTHFTAPVTGKGKKIYIVGKNEFIHYVGITKQSIRTRLRYGVSPNHASGYHGYKWLEENGDHCLVIWSFAYDVNVESVEAEIVYLLRKQYKQWPKYQTEIHFHQTGENERSLAKKIVKETHWIVQNFQK